MTRVLALADVHAGDLAWSKPDPATGIPSALLSVDRCLGAAVDAAIERAVDVVVISGDVFHRPNPTAIALNLFDGQLRRLTVEGIPVVISGGNHDRPQNPNEANVLQLFHDPPHVYVSTRPEVIRLEDLAVATLPNVSIHQLMARYPGMTWTEGRDRMTDALISVLGSLRAEAPSGSVLSLHWSIEGCIGGGERDLSLMVNEPVIPLAELEGPWAWVAAGHIHHQQLLSVPDADPRALPLMVGAYAGSTDRRNFGEQDDRKVALVLDVDGEAGWKAELEFVDLPSRRFLTWDITNEEPYIGAPEAALGDVAGAIVRLKGERGPGWSAEAVGRALRAITALGAATVVDNTHSHREMTQRAASITEALGPVEVFDQWMQLRGLPEEERPSLREGWKRLVEETDAR